jgi:plastocyanin
MTLAHLARRVGPSAALVIMIAGCGGAAATQAPGPTTEPTPAPAEPTPAPAEPTRAPAEPTPAPDATVATGATLVVEASEFKYVPAELTIPSAGSSTIELVIVGVVEHDFTIDALELQIAAPVGEAVTGTLTDPPAGTYEVYCTVAGHKAAGMVGTLVVEG